MSGIQTVRLAVTTTGANGSATGSTTSETLFGFILDVYLDFHASTPATADTTIAYAGRGGNILVVADSTTDGLYQPRTAIHDAAGATISGGYDYYAVNDKITVSLAGGNALTDAVVAYIRIITP